MKKKHGCEMYFNVVGVRECWGVLVDKKLRYKVGHSSLFVMAGSLCLMSQLPNLASGVDLLLSMQVHLFWTACRKILVKK